METRKHIKHLSKRYARPIEASDYLDYRSKKAPDLPSVDTLLRMFGSWDDVLREAGVDPERGAEDLDRIPNHILVLALQNAADDLGVKTLSSHAYDRWRTEFMESGKQWHETRANPPSSSVIRKWLGFWGDSVATAGLESQKRNTPRRPSTVEIINALNEAKTAVPGMLSQTAYQMMYDDLTEEEQEKFPTVDEILISFPNWETALRTADVEQSDVLHPDGLWTAEECRRIAKQAEILLGEPLNQSNYKLIVEKSHTPKPSWKVLQELLRQ